MGLGWSSPNLPILLSDASPLETGPITMIEASWISSLFCIGGGVGSIFFCWLPDSIGRKWSIFLLGVPQIISWALIAFTSQLHYLYMARFLIGMSGGGIIVVIPLFVTEISDDK